METQKVWHNFNEELFFFILKKVKNESATNDIFQNTFLKIHKKLHQLENDEKVRAWIFQIARNEIANYLNKESIYLSSFNSQNETALEKYQTICCFDKFVYELPDIYKKIIELIYIKGLKQKEAAEILEISLTNVKARTRRAKDILKQKFNECCKYEFDKDGKLIGESNCSICKS